MLFGYDQSMTFDQGSNVEKDEGFIVFPDDAGRSFFPHYVTENAILRFHLVIVSFAVIVLLCFSL